MANILILLAVVFFLETPVFSRRQRRQPEELTEQCHRPANLNATLENCTAVKTFFYYVAETRTCHPYNDCEENGANRFAKMKVCLDTCNSSPRKTARRCQQQLKGKAPERCRWVRATSVNVAVVGGCPKYQLQCTGGPCSTRPCRAPCEICTYNLEFTVRNCSLVTRVDGDGEECPPPFRCERDVRCKAEVDNQDILVNVTPSTLPYSTAKVPQVSATAIASTTPSIITVSTEWQPFISPKTELLEIPASSTAPSTSTTQATVLAQQGTNSCFLPVKYDSCPSQDSEARRVWYFDLQSKLCRKFYGANTCSGNANGFGTKEECVRVCQSNEGCPTLVKKQLPLGCRYEERKALDGCLTLAMVCTDKPGRCPLPTGKGAQNICYKECERDADCKDEMKCCANGCASLCVAPAPSLTTMVFANTSEPMPSLERVKAGACPKAKRQSRAHRNCSAEQCSVDDDCAGAKKCCLVNGCGRVCHSPVEASPPKSPIDRSACSSNPCLPTERCTPLPPSSSKSDLPYVCQPIEHLAAFDPCRTGKHTCTPEEHCLYEPQMCLTGPCSQYRCLPSPPPGFRRKGGEGSNVKRRAELARMDPSNDPCSLNPCRPCQRCVPLDFTTDDGKQLTGDSKFVEYRCENNCPGECEECSLSGRCVVVNQPYICRTNRAGDPCLNRTCEAYTNAKCIVDPCHCLRVRFVVESGAEVSPDECRFSLNRQATT